MVNSSLICLAEEIWGAGFYNSVHPQKCFPWQVVVEICLQGRLLLDASNYGVEVVEGGCCSSMGWVCGSPLGAHGKALKAMQERWELG